MQGKSEHDYQVPDNYRSSSRDDMLPFLPSHYQTVLEIGCGEAGFKQNLPNTTDYWGVEPDSEAVRLAKQRYKDSNFICGLFPQDEQRLPDNYFDVIVCNDIIEHVENTEELFRFLRNKLAKNGVLVASIPNVRHISNLKELLLKKDWEYKDSGTLDRTHLRFYTKKSIVRLCEEHGFELENIEGINGILDGTDTIVESLYRYIKFGIPILLLGADTQYMQFGIRAKAKNND